MIIHSKTAAIFIPVQGRNCSGFSFSMRGIHSVLLQFGYTQPQKMREASKGGSRNCGTPWKVRLLRSGGKGCPLQGSRNGRNRIGQISLTASRICREALPQCPGISAGGAECLAGCRCSRCGGRKNSPGFSPRACPPSRWEKGGRPRSARPAG